MYCKARETRVCIHIYFSSGVLHALWKHSHTAESFFLLVIQAIQMFFQYWSYSNQRYCTRRKFSCLFLLLCASYFIFTPVRGILILVIWILLYSYQRFHCQACNNTLSKQNWSINKKDKYSTRSHASKYTSIKTYVDLQKWAI